MFLIQFHNKPFIFNVPLQEWRLQKIQIQKKKFISNKQGLLIIILTVFCLQSHSRTERVFVWTKNWKVQSKSQREFCLNQKLESACLISQTICWRGWDDNACLGVGNTSSIGAWPNSLDRRQQWYCIVSPPLQNTSHADVFI